MSMRTVVVLPHPLGPIRPTIAPGSIVRFSRLTTSVSSNVIVRSSATMPVPFGRVSRTTVCPQPLRICPAGVGSPSRVDRYPVTTGGKRCCDERSDRAVDRWLTGGSTLQLAMSEATPKNRRGWAAGSSLRVVSRCRRGPARGAARPPRSSIPCAPRTTRVGHGGCGRHRSTASRGGPGTDRTPTSRATSRTTR